MSVSSLSTKTIQLAPVSGLLLWQRPAHTVEITIAIRGSSVRKDGTAGFGYAGSITMADCAPITYCSPALAREAHAVRAMAVRRARAIVRMILGGRDDHVTYNIIWQKAGITTRLNLLYAILDRGGYNSDYSRTDALHVWKPFHEHYSQGLIHFREFTGLVRKAPKGFKDLMKIAIVQRDFVKQWQLDAYQAAFGDTFDRYDIEGYRGPQSKAA